MAVAFYPASPAEIRTGTVARLVAAKSNLGLQNVFTARTQPGQDDQLPYAIVWNAGERTEPNGDANAGAPSFIHTMTLVVDIMASADDDASLDTEIVNMAEAIRATLMTDPDWVMLFEGLERCSTKYAYPKEATSKVAQGLIEFELTYRSDWEPEIPNALSEVHIETTAPIAGVETIIDFPQS